jgi:hypothetical protein
MATPTPEELAAEAELQSAIEKYMTVAGVKDPDSLLVDWMVAIASVTFDDDGQKGTRFGFAAKQTTSAHSMLGLAEYTAAYIKHDLVSGDGDYA